MQMNIELHQFWKWYAARWQNSHPGRDIVLRMVIAVAMWAAIYYIVYATAPQAYWRYFKGALANPLFLLFLISIYVKKVVVEFLRSRLTQETKLTTLSETLQEGSLVKAYRQTFGASDLFYKLYYAVGWGSAGILVCSGFYWFFSLHR
jgi:hypothetical protein